MRLPTSVASRFAVAAVGAALACFLGAGIGQALTGSNTIASGGQAGEGSGAISGYTVGTVQYGLNTSSPQNIDSVTFTISPSNATTVKVQLAGNWYTCSNSSGNVSCTTTSPQATAAAASSLTVVAVQ